MSNGIKIPYNKPYFDNQEIKAVKKTLKSGWITTGKVCREFEEMFADYVGSRYAVAVSSCTAALDLCVKYLNLSSNDKIIVPSFTFCATAQAVINNNINVIFGGIDVEDYCLSVSSEKLKNIQAVIPVNYGGMKASTDYNLPIIVDSAHRLVAGQCKNDKFPSCFSFYANKNITCGEGGMIATNDKFFYEWLIKARSHGINKRTNYDYDVEFVGMKVNLPDVLAAIGLEQLKKIDEINEKRQQVVNWYNERLGKKWQGLHIYPVFAGDYLEFIKYMENNGVQCSHHFNPLHKMSAFSEHNENEKELLITERIAKQQVSLPLYPGLTKKEVNYICDLIKKYV